MDSTWHGKLLAKWHPWAWPATVRTAGGAAVRLSSSAPQSQGARCGRSTPFSLTALSVIQLKCRLLSSSSSSITDGFELRVNKTAIQAPFINLIHHL